MKTIAIEEGLRTMALIGVVVFGVLPVARVLGADLVRVAQLSFPVAFLIFPIAVGVRARTGRKLQITTRRGWFVSIAVACMLGAGIGLLYGGSAYKSWDQVAIGITIGVLVTGAGAWLGTRLIPLR